MNRTTMTAPDGRQYIVTTQSVGRGFGTYGVVKAMNGRIVHATDPHGYGFHEAAMRDAAKWVARRPA